MHGHILVRVRSLALQYLSRKIERQTMRHETKTHTNTADPTQGYWHNSTQCVPHKSTTLIASQKARLPAYCNSHNEALCFFHAFSHTIDSARSHFARSVSKDRQHETRKDTQTQQIQATRILAQRQSMRSSQTGQHKPHSASRSICLTPPRTEVALHTQQRQAIQFHSTKLNRFPQRTNAQLCHATRRNTAHAQTENCPHKTAHDAPHSASSQ
jgi:hypothetical protein